MHDKAIIATISATVARQLADFAASQKGGGGFTKDLAREFGVATREAIRHGLDPLAARLRALEDPTGQLTAAGVLRAAGVERFHSTLIVKSIDEGTRTIRGIASHASPDREGDIVVPEGARSSGELPLLLHHDPRQPVGHARLERSSGGALPFVATVAKVDEPGTLRDRLEETWASIRADLLRGVSIGFRPLKSEPIANGGRRFLEVEVVELSLTTVPMHPRARVTEAVAA